MSRADDELICTNAAPALTIRAPAAPSIPVCSWEVLTSPEDWRSNKVQEIWHAEAARSASVNVNALNQSPEWFEHMYKYRGTGRLIVAVCRDSSGRLIGIAPLRIARYSMGFHVGSYTLGGVTFLKAWMMGGQPLLPERPELYDTLFGAIYSAFPECDCIGLAAVREDGFLWRHLQESKAIRRQFVPYLPDGLRRYHTAPLPPTFEEYLGHYRKKKRDNRKREVRLLREYGKGSLELLRVDNSKDLQSLLEIAFSLESQARNSPDYFSWLGTRDSTKDRLTDLADRRLLRSYVLRCGGVSLAYLHGLQFEGVYSAIATAFDRAYARFSPGAVLFHLAAQDLIGHRPASVMDFAFGDPLYTSTATDTWRMCGSILLLRNTFMNRIRRQIHATFQNTVGLVKRSVIFLGLRRLPAKPI